MAFMTRGVERTIPPPINVMHVVDVLGLAGMEFGVMKLVNGLAKTSIRSSIVCIRSRLVAAKQILHPEIPVFELHKPPGRDLRSVMRLAALLRKERIDVLHSHNWPTYFYSVMAAKLARVPILLHGEHGREAQAQSGRRTRLCSWLAYGVTHFVTVSEELARTLAVSWNVRPERISCIPNGVNLDLFGQAAGARSLRRDLQLTPECPVLMNIGRLVPVKDHPTLLRAFALVLKARPDARLLIIGGKAGSEGKHYAAAEVQHRIDALVKSLGIEHAVRLTDTRQDVADLLAMCQVYVNSSAFEGMSNTILEAMASGRPVVATAVGGNPELVQDGVTGYLVPSGDSHAMAQRILTLLDDPAQAAAFGRSARQAVEHRHSMAGMIEAYRTLYQELYRGDGSAGTLSSQKPTQNGRACGHS